MQCDNSLCIDYCFSDFVYSFRTFFLEKKCRKNLYFIIDLFFEISSREKQLKNYNNDAKENGYCEMTLNLL